MSWFGQRSIGHMETNWSSLPGPMREAIGIREVSRGNREQGTEWGGRFQMWCMKGKPLIVTEKTTYQEEYSEKPTKAGISMK